MTLDELIERLQEARGFNGVRGHWPVEICGVGFSESDIEIKHSEQSVQIYVAVEPEMEECECC